MHPERDYAAAVFGSTQGSGYLLTERLIVTSRHVVDGADEVTAIVPNGVGEVRCQVLRASSATDVAVLRAERSLVGDRLVAALEFAELKDLQPWPDARALGYPDVQRGQSRNLDIHQVVGRFNPGTGSLSGGAVLENLDQPIGDSPWAGMSGAAVFVEGLLVGIVRSDPSAWQHGRLTLVPAQALLKDEEFGYVFQLCDFKIRTRTLTSPGAGAAATFEQRLLNYVATQADRLWLTGARVAYGSGSGDDYWSLQDTYLSLHLAERGNRDARAGDGKQPQPAASALAGKKRVLLVGGAGTGKTTLLQWLASTVARRSLAPDLAALGDCIPLLVQLRTLLKQDELPGPEQLLAAVAKPLAGHPDAAGWLSGRLEHGKVLLMVDGLDEIPAASRKRTRKWLGDLIDAYPDNYYILTTRPSTVPDGWLAQRGFAELETQPMGNDEIVGLITRWFDAVATQEESRYHQEWMERLKTEAVSVVLGQPDMMRLATSPLLCTLICALLVDDSSARLPRTRAALYRGAVRMLLESRETTRGISGSQRLGYHEQFHLLKRLAFWLSINDTTEVGTERAVKLVEVASLPMRGALNDDNPAGVLRTLLIGCGLLQETSEQTIRFSQLPFQHYFTAVAALEEGSIGLLVSHAQDEEWSEILVLAAAEGRTGDCDQLMRGLLDRRTREPQHADQLTKIARRCLDHAEKLSPAVRSEAAGALAA